MKQVTPINNQQNNVVHSANVTKRFIESQSDLNDQEKLTLELETQKILSNCCPNESQDKIQNTGLVYGYVQSGKTMSFTALCALAKDNDYSIVVILTGIKTNLLRQTNGRLMKELSIADENNFKLITTPTRDDADKICGYLNLSYKPLVVITIMKNANGLQKLNEVFKTDELNEEIKNKGVLIIDDEADQASLNTKASANAKNPHSYINPDLSTTYANILELRGSLSVHTYIQYTATPQAILAIAKDDDLSPDFHVLLTPGINYTGGKIFFQEKEKELIFKIPEKEVFVLGKNDLKKIPQSLVDAFDHYIISATIEVGIFKNEKTASMMVHCHQNNDPNEMFYKWIEKLLKKRKRVMRAPAKDYQKQLLVKNYKKLFLSRKENYNIIDLDELITKIADTLNDTNTELIIKDNQFSEQDFKNNSSHVLVGAEKLNRGFTVKGLMVTYLTRNSKSDSNADTLEQRCRFFGYKRKYLRSCKVFLTRALISDYKDYVEHEEDLRERLSVSDNTKEILREFVLAMNLKLTRRNVLSKKPKRNSLSGKWTTIHNFGYARDNSKHFKTLYTKHKNKLKSVKEVFVNYSAKGRNSNHTLVEIDKKQAEEIFDNFKVTKDNTRTTQTLKNFISSFDAKIYLIFMGSSATTQFERKLVIRNKRNEIQKIHSGVDTSGPDKYPGDEGIKSHNSICIQVYYLALKSKDSQLDKKRVHTITVWCPENKLTPTVVIEN